MHASDEDEVVVAGGKWAVREPACAGGTGRQGVRVWSRWRCRLLSTILLCFFWDCLCGQ